MFCPFYIMESSQQPCYPLLCGETTRTQPLNQVFLNSVSGLLTTVLSCSRNKSPRFQRVNCGNPCKIHISFGGINLATLYSVIALVRVRLYSQISLQNVPGTFQDALSIVHNLEPLRDIKTLPAHLQLTSTNFWKIYLFLHKFIVSF